MTRLTDAKIRDAKFNGKPYHLRDSTLPGFFVQVNRSSVGTSGTPWVRCSSERREMGGLVHSPRRAIRAAKCHRD